MQFTKKLPFHCFFLCIFTTIFKKKRKEYHVVIFFTHKFHKTIYIVRTKKGVIMDLPSRSNEGDDYIPPFKP